MRIDFWRERTQKKKAADSTTSDTPGKSWDRELAERIGKGDREALALWLDRHLGAVYGYAARRLGPGLEEIASEVTRETFEDAMRHLRPYARGTTSIPMQLWLMRKAGDRLARRRDKIIETPSTGESRQLSRLRDAMSDMSPRREAALALALFEGLSAPEMASAIGVTQGRAMGRLRGALRVARSVVENPDIGGDRRG